MTVDKRLVICNGDKGSRYKGVHALGMQQNSQRILQYLTFLFSLEPMYEQIA